MPYKDKEKQREYTKKYHLLRYARNREKMLLYKRKYRLENPEKIKIMKHKYYLKRKEYFQEKARQYYQSHREDIRAYKRLYAHSTKNRFISYKKSARERGYVFRLLFSDFERIFNSPCHFCNLNIAKGIDRKNNNIGYILQNCLPCCKQCNYMKRDLSYKDFLSHVSLIRGNLNL
jgi:hypothetical protein